MLMADGHECFCGFEDLGIAGAFESELETAHVATGKGAA
jgi:hypothetical protein